MDGKTELVGVAQRRADPHGGRREQVSMMRKLQLQEKKVVEAQQAAYNSALDAQVEKTRLQQCAAENAKEQRRREEQVLGAAILTEQVRSLGLGGLCWRVLRGACPPAVLEGTHAGCRSGAPPRLSLSLLSLRR